MSDPEPSWDLYGAFLAVVRRGSLSGASRALAASTPEPPPVARARDPRSDAA